MSRSNRNEADELAAAVSAAYDESEIGPVPQRLNDFAKAAFAWRHSEAKLAEIVFDSQRDELAGVRGPGTERRTFRYRALGTEVHVSLTDATITVMVDDHSDVRVRIVSSSNQGEEVGHHTTDEFGELTAESPSLPARIELDLPMGTSTTPWIIG